MSVGLTDWVRSHAPNLDVVSASVPEPTLREHNLVAVCDDPDRMRSLVRDWERIEPADAGVGFVVMGVAPDRPSETERPTGADPERVTGTAFRAALPGALAGAAVGAVVVAAIVWLLDGWSGVVIGAALGGAAFGSVAGGFLAFTNRASWGAAYRHSFVDPEATAVAFASIHSSEAGHIDDALHAVDDGSSITVYRVDRDGRADLAVR